MLQEPMFFPNFQPKIELENATSLLNSWATKKQIDDPTLSLRSIAQLIINGFGGLAHTWWHYASTEAQEAILGHNDPVVQFLVALRAQFVGITIDEDLDHYSKLFMSNQLGNLGLMEDYFCQMQDWLIRSNSYANTTYLKRYIHSMPNVLPTTIKKYFEDKHLSLSAMTLAMVHGHIKKVIEEHCLAKRVITDYKEYNKIFSNKIRTSVG